MAKAVTEFALQNQNGEMETVGTANEVWEVYKENCKNNIVLPVFSRYSFDNGVKGSWRKDSAWMLSNYVKR